MSEYNAYLAALTLSLDGNKSNFSICINGASNIADKGMANKNDNRIVAHKLMMIGL